MVVGLNADFSNFECMGRVLQYKYWEQTEEPYVGDLDYVLGSCYETLPSIYDGLYSDVGIIMNGKTLFRSDSN